MDLKYPSLSHREDVAAIDDALDRLSDADGLTHARVVPVESRYFSRIYAIEGDAPRGFSRYILKIGTDGRSCHDEFHQYELLQERGIRTLTPVAFSAEHNFLVTRRETLITFDRHLAGLDRQSRRNEFRRLGELFSVLDARTGHDTLFAGKAYENYVLPRLDQLTFLSNAERHDVESCCRSLSASLDGTATRHCFVSDFSLGNIHVDSEGELVLLDHGDATVGDSTSNVAYVYLSIKFGPPNIHFSSRREVESHFREFLSGYDEKVPGEALFVVYRILHLINMLSFTESRCPEMSMRPRNAVSFVSNRYLVDRYKKYLLRITRKTDVR